MNFSPRFFPPASFLVLFLLAWGLAVETFAPPSYLLPGPWQVAEAVGENWHKILQAMLLTSSASALGFVSSLVLGLGLAFLFSEFRFLRQSLYPYAIFFQTVPIVAIVPLIVTWFGTGFASIVIMAAVVSLFPVITNGTTGFLSLEKNYRELFSIYQASRWQLFWKARLPRAVPFLVSGAKISVGLAVVGAIVGEFYAGYGTQAPGLGYLILQASHQLKTPYLFGLVLASTCLGLFFFVLVTLVGKWMAMQWRGYDYDAS